MSTQPEIWLPTSEMKVTVQDGQVTMWETMTMEKKKVKKEAGFAEKEKADEHG